MLTCAFASAVGNAGPAVSVQDPGPHFVREAAASVASRGCSVHPLAVMLGAWAQAVPRRYFGGEDSILGAAAMDQASPTFQPPRSCPQESPRVLSSQRRKLRPARREGELVIQNVRRSGPLVPQAGGLQPDHRIKEPVKLCPRGRGRGVFSHRLLTWGQYIQGPALGAMRTQL